jgi:hypothetical protein
MRLARRLASATATAAIVPLFSFFFDRGFLAWGSYSLWAFTALVFFIACYTYGKID